MGLLQAELQDQGRQAGSAGSDGDLSRPWGPFQCAGCTQSEDTPGPCRPPGPSRPAHPAAPLISNVITFI